MPEKGLQWEATKFILRISYVMNIPIIVFLCLSLTEFCCWYLTDVNLAFEAGNSKLLDVVSVADVDAKEHIVDSLATILMLKFSRGFENEMKILVKIWSLVTLLLGAIVLIGMKYELWQTMKFTI